MQRYLVTSRLMPGSMLVDAEVAHTLLKAQEAGARMVFDLTDDLFGKKSRQEQNSALLYDGYMPLAISVEGHIVTLEPIKE